MALWLQGRPRLPRHVFLGGRLHSYLVIPPTRHQRQHRNAAAAGSRRSASTAATNRVITPSTHKFDHKTDVLIIGSGGAGLTASLRAHSHGLSSLVVEKADKLGGASAYSGGGLWIPGNHLAREEGRDHGNDRESLLAYFAAKVGDDVGPASSLARREAYVKTAPEMVRFLADLGFRWVQSRGYPDYYPDAPGANALGERTIEGARFDTRKLGDWKDLLLRMPGADVPPMHTFEMVRVTRMFSSLSNTAWVAKAVGGVVLSALMGRKEVSMGGSLIAQLMLLNKERNAEIWRSSPLVGLLRDGSDGGGAVVGAVVRRTSDGKEVSIGASRGVLLCAGGFARNQAMREKYGPAPASTAWTSTPPNDTGDAIRVGMDAGAATALMDDAWWGPTMVDPNMGVNVFTLFDRARPFGVMVDQLGRRFMNEAEPYTDAGHHQYARHEETGGKAIPAWLIVDATYRKKYTLGSLPPRVMMNPKKALASGLLVKADTINDLAAQTGIDRAGLVAELERFNCFAREGKDKDFGRGDDAYDRYFGDPSTGLPNPNLGPVEKPPFWAVKMWPGDLGTKGGLLTDEAGRVLREKDGGVIEGLYATGNTTASIMGRTYLGPGATLGPAMTFAYLAVDDMAKKKAA